MLGLYFGSKDVCDRYILSYGDHNPWIATLGCTPEQRFDPKTGREDFAEHRKVRNFLENWRPEQKWVPQKICLHVEVRDKKRNKSDRIFNDMVGPFLSENAVGKMRPWLEKEGCVLPLDVVNSDEKYFLWWVPIIEESYDLARSEKFPNGQTVKRYAFDQRKLREVTAFRPHHRGAYNPQAQGKICVNNDFKQAWIDAELTGIEFKIA